MNLFENLRIALRAITANKLRSGLTMLGIIIGVGAVVALMSIGKGATESVTSRVENLGSNLISISSMGGFFRPQSGTGARLYLADYEALVKELKNVAGYAPAYQSSYTIKYGTATATYTITGVTEDFTKVRAYTLAQGRLLTQADRLSKARVAVLGSQTATDIFSTLNPIGREIKINGVTFTVVGVLESKGSSGFASGDDLVLIPLETGYAKLFGGRSMLNGKRILTQLSLSASNPEVVDQVIAAIELIMRRQHKLTLTDDLDVSITSQSQILQNLTGITDTLTYFLGAIAAISLLVGGIGIMNITLVSVTERTREIGLRKAVGARRGAILMQFLVETITLSITGGLLGIGLGASIAWAVTTSGLIQAQVTMDTILLSFFFAAMIGIFFGIYPAFRAAGLRPIEALRYE
jgi:putative ABC transport system permease protein